ncbi:MAG: SMC-Scp complex subunit ScpB [Planctomycetaceae bacterium]|nr:SMC-Scp complex subunit ScpB [Planctomycetaceae bacterium]
MRASQDIIPIEKSRFPGAVAFVETFDTDDDAESANILSFESLRKAFATFQTDDTELAETIPEVAAISERPDYDLDTTIDEEDDSRLPVVAESSVVVNARLESIIEAIMFVGNQENRPLGAKQIIEKLRNVTAEEVEQTVVRLNEHYQERNAPYRIISEGGGYWMTLRPEFEQVRANFYGKIRESRLSQQAIDTLAVVAYRQPITAEEIQDHRQQPCSTVLNQLVRRNLLKTSREVQDKKSIVRYHTTPRFLELCQIKSLDDLPRVDELGYR